MSKLDPSWPDGPWDDEPDLLEFAVLSVRCLCLRNWHFGTWCGYVIIPSRRGVEPGLLTVHQGITCSTTGSGFRRMFGLQGRPEVGLRVPVRSWVLGFDCMHSDDYLPMYAAMGIAPIPGMEYRTLDYVADQCRSLAEQVLYQRATL